MKIIFLDANTIGEDIDLSVFEKFGILKVYSFTEEDEINDKVKEADADIIITNKCKMNSETLSNTHVKLICLTATGYDNVDIDYCSKNKIAVCNVTGYSTQSVVQHTFALLLALEEKLIEYNTYVKSGEYINDKSFKYLKYTFNELANKTFGIIGMGKIGAAVAEVAESFGCNVVYWSSTNVDRNSKYNRLPFDEILKNSDIISIHAPLNDSTKNLFDINAFKKMKETAIIVNVGRGAIINEKDLVNAINKNMIAGAALDVLVNEPMTKDSPYLNIINSPKLIITPHIAWAAVESRKRCIDEICTNINYFIEDKHRNRVDI